MLKVVEIFNSVDGEVNSFGQGTPTTFIRFAGCNLTCPYCDTPGAAYDQPYTEMTAEQIIQQVEQIGCPKITLTGGEPLLQPMDDLLKIATIFQSSMETNGTLPIAPYTRLIDSVIMNYKRQSPPLIENFLWLGKGDYFKIMIDGPNMLQDNIIQDIIALVRGREIRHRPTIALSPVLDKVSAAQVIEFIQKHKLWNVKLNVQLHKFIDVR